MTLSARSMPFRRGRWRGLRTRPEPTAASTWNQASRRRARSASASSGSIAPRSVVPGRADDRDHVLAGRLRVERLERHRAGRVGLDADHGLGAEAEQRRRAADAVVAGLGGDDPPGVARQAVAAHVRARPVAGQQQPEQVRGGAAHRHHAGAVLAQPVLAREPARPGGPRRTSPRARRRRRPSTGWSARPRARRPRPRSAARGAGERRSAGRRGAGCRRARPAGPRARGASGAPSGGHGSSARAVSASCSVVSGVRGPGAPSERVSASTVTRRRRAARRGWRGRG